jgi:predicted DNA binding CopG/RHH family protein
MIKNKKIRPIPKFKNENEERNFWDTHDATEYFDLNKQVKLDLSSLKPSTRPVTIRLPESLIYSLKILANKRDIPYQSLTKMFLADRVKQEFKS